MIETRAIDALREVFSGELMLPDAPAYDEARTVFNAMIDKRPAGIARCATTADVAASVTFARENDLVVSVRCGGRTGPPPGSSAGGVLADPAAPNTTRDGPPPKPGP